MKAKPRVIKRQSGWLVLKPGFGFGDGELIGPFPSQREAFRYALGRAHAASANAMKAPSRRNRPGTGAGGTRCGGR